MVCQINSCCLAMLICVRPSILNSPSRVLAQENTTVIYTPVASGATTKLCASMGDVCPHAEGGPPLLDCVGNQAIPKLVANFIFTIFKCKVIDLVRGRCVCRAVLPVGVTCDLGVTVKRVCNTHMVYTSLHCGDR